MSKIKELFPESAPGLIMVTNETYNLHDIMVIQEGWVIRKIKDCIKDNKDKIQLRLLEEDNFEDIYKIYLKCNIITEDLESERDYRKNIIRVSNPLFDKVDPYIPNETSLVQASDYLFNITKDFLIKNITLPDDFLLKYYNGSTTLSNLYKQFKGKENFINVINYIRSKVGIKENN